VAQQVHVELELGADGREREHRVVLLRVEPGPRPQEAETRAHPADVGVHRDVREPVGEEQHARRRLAADPRERAEERLRLRDQGGRAEIRSFGLLQGARGRGVGGHLLVHALRRGFALAPRVWLHTCTLDDPRALPNYEARGLQVFDVRSV
jgi:GNAT superfamily N-acetyltransferase